MHIVTGRAQIPIAAALDDNRLVATAKDVSEELLPMVQPDRVAAQEPAHPRHQVGVGRLDHQVKVVAHQTIRMYLKTGLLARFRQGLKKILPIHVIHIDVLLAVPTAHDVVNRSGVLHS